MLRKLLTSAVIASVVATAQMPIAGSAMATGATQEKPKRQTRLVGPTVGKKVQKAFEFYTADDIDNAIATLMEAKSSKGYDKAYVDYFLAQMYVAKGGEELKALEYLQGAIDADILNETEHAGGLRLLADLDMQVKRYQGAIKYYKAWMDFTDKQDGGVYVRIAQAYYELKQLDKMIEPADQAIAIYNQEGKPNQNPYILKVQSYYERKMYKQAIPVLETMVKGFPTEKRWWSQLGMFYMLVEDYSSALATLDLAYKQGFLEKESEIKTLANLYASNEIPFKSAQLLEKHIASGLIQRDDKNLATLANAWHAAQHIDKAAKYYGEIAKMTNSGNYYRKQGMLLKQDEQFSKAVIALNKALDLDADNKGRIYMSLAESYFYMEDYKNAYLAIKKAEQDPKSAKSAKAWVSFIRDTAKRKGVNI